MNKSDITRDYYMLKGSLAKLCYDWWWHSFTARRADTGEEKSFYIEYFLCNPAHAKRQPVIVWNDPTKQKQGIKPSYCMVNAGYWGKEKGQLHRFFSWKDVKIRKDRPLHLRVKDCLCTETRIKGSVAITEEDVKKHPEWMCDAGSMSWDLTVDKQISYHVGYGASKLFQKLNAFEMFWHAEGMKTAFEGTLTLNGIEYTVTPDTCYGYADKNWGSDFTSPWIWLSSNHLISTRTGKTLKNSVFEVGGGCPKVFGISLKEKLLGQFYYEGKDYEFNFSKFWTGSRTYFNCYETKTKIVWKIVQTTFHTKMVVHIACPKDEMIWINYESPNGKKLHNRLWNCGNGYGSVSLYEKHNQKWCLVDKVLAKNVGCEYGKY